MRIPEIIVNGAAGTIYLPDGYVLPLTLSETRAWQPVSLLAPHSDLIAQPVVLWLLAQRMDGTGYTASDFRKLRAQRTRARERLSAAAMINGSKSLAWGCAKEVEVDFSTSNIRMRTSGYDPKGSALTYDQRSMTNIMRRLVNPCAEWVG